MTFDELQALAEKDLKLNDTELDLESLKTPQLHNKYCKFHNQYINILKKAEQDRDRLLREKWEYYTGKADPLVYQEKPFNIKLDDDLVKLEQKVTYVQSVVDYLDKTIRIISNRTFQIKNAIEWKKFTSGII